MLEDENLTLSVPETEMKWGDAAQYCFKNGGHLVVANDDHVQTLLGTLMKLKSIAFLWIGAKERDTGWTWADDNNQGMDLMTLHNVT